jgi:hypothetical protein
MGGHIREGKETGRFGDGPVLPPLQEQEAGFNCRTGSHPKDAAAITAVAPPGGKADGSRNYKGYRQDDRGLKNHHLKMFV